MQTINAQTIIDGASMAIGWDKAQMEPREQQMAREAFSLALQEVWDAWWWEELMVCQQIPGATTYTAATAFAADAFCYFPATQKFYQAMQATTGNDPAVPDATGNYVTNFAYWTEAKAMLNAPDYAPGNTYALGNQVRSPITGLFYQLYQTSSLIEISGFTYDINQGTYSIPLGLTGCQTIYLITGTGNANGLFVYQGTDGNNTATWTNDNGDRLRLNQGYNWVLSTADMQSVWGINLPTDGSYLSNIYPAESPNNTWRQMVPDCVGLPVINPLTMVQPPLDAGGEWHALIPFTPDVPVAGTVRTVSVMDPRRTTNPMPYTFQKADDGVRVINLVRGEPWVWYRRATPVITGDAFDATATYTAMPANQLTFDN